jgi:peptidoglycan/xylan/chitin deacetylase (PgdA/CDA1 family)
MNKYGYTWCGIIFISIVCFFIVQKHIDIKESFASLSPNIGSASAIGQSFQNMPEDRTTSGSIKIPIFIYHSVRPYDATEDQEQQNYDITPELFEQQLKYLADNGYTTISMDQVASDMQTGSVSPILRPVVLTFDDGWHNQYKYAFPLLKKYNMTATFYIYTNPIGTKHYLTWDEVREMDSAGMTIADHSLDHPYFKGLTLDKVRHEITRSRTIIEKQIGKPVLHFASPFGYTDPNIMAIVKEVGYITGRTTYKGVTQDNPFRLRGILVTDSLNYFISELKK